MSRGHPVHTWTWLSATTLTAEALSECIARMQSRTPQPTWTMVSALAPTDDAKLLACKCVPSQCIKPFTLPQDWQ